MENGSCDGPQVVLQSVTLRCTTFVRADEVLPKCSMTNGEVRSISKLFANRAQMEELGIAFNGSIMQRPVSADWPFGFFEYFTYITVRPARGHCLINFPGIRVHLLKLAVCLQQVFAVLLL